MTTNGRDGPRFPMWDCDGRYCIIPPELSCPDLPHGRRVDDTRLSTDTVPIGRDPFWSSRTVQCHPKKCHPVGIHPVVGQDGIPIAALLYQFAHQVRYQNTNTEYIVIDHDIAHVYG